MVLFMKKLSIKWCVTLALSASMVFGGMVMAQAAYDDVVCAYEVGFRPLDFPKPNYD